MDSLTCTYGQFTAVNEVSFTVQEGRIHALLGTNGAGKTTLLETIQGFHRPRSGTVRVFGQDPWRHRTAVAARTGTMLQESGLVDEMTVLGQLSLWRGLNVREDSIDRVLEVVGLMHRRKTPVAVLSGGERRRLDFAMAIWGHPELIVLDEPTTGLDPQSRRTMWDIIRELNAKGSTILLTTHYLDEAQNLADHVTILDRGCVAIEGPMTEVLASIPAHISFRGHLSNTHLAELQRTVRGEVEISRTDDDLTVTIRTPLLQLDVGAVIDWARSHNLPLHQLRCSPASLEDVFFEVPAVNAPSNAPIPVLDESPSLRGSTGHQAGHQATTVDNGDSAHNPSGTAHRKATP
ncbi:ABC transporter ATP-binding protein [Devriesea agamarum]|uniref:ABC transporter ATP-binding protein n=1 Tax=Devriesea agamarum TaxID=472569 RepID=UPI0018D441F3|nr:ABC transporter ATP-binding protein [Devriesea agamarum]